MRRAHRERRKRVIRAGCALVLGAWASGCTASLRADCDERSAPPRCAALEAVMTATFGAIEQHYARWSEFLRELEADERPVAPRVEEYRQEHGVPLNCWAGSSFRRIGFEFPAFVWQRPDSFHNADLAAYLEGNAPCDPMLTFFAKQIPASDPEEVYSADVIYEIDRRGASIRRWRVPRDSLVEGLSGEELRIRYTLIPLCRPPMRVGRSAPGLAGHPAEWSVPGRRLPSRPAGWRTWGRAPDRPQPAAARGAKGHKPQAAWDRGPPAQPRGDGESAAHGLHF